MAQIAPSPSLGCLAAVAALTLLGCLKGHPGSGPPDAGDDPIDSPTRVEVGIPDETGTGFVALEEGDTVAVETYGQGGNHAVFAIACTGFGNAVYPQVVLENLDDGSIIETAPYVRPQPVACDVDGRCVDSQVFVMLGGLAEPGDLDGLPVRVTALVSNDEGLLDEGRIDVVFQMDE